MSSDCQKGSYTENDAYHDSSSCFLKALAVRTLRRTHLCSDKSPKGPKNPYLTLGSCLPFAQTKITLAKMFLSTDNLNRKCYLPFFLPGQADLGLNYSSPSTLCDFNFLT